MIIEDLEYPMFKLNWYEKLVLRRIKKNLLKEEGSFYLCNHLYDYPYLIGEPIRKKIRKALGGYFSLDSYQERQCRRYARRVMWIDKLLEYNK